MSATPLFDSKLMSLADKVHHLERLLKMKCKTHYISFGLMRGGAKLPNTYSIHGTITLPDGNARAISREVESFDAMIDNLIEILETF